uniref:hypothetical protein n=1 Tax=uncultured Sphingomonas sp. TaxID=158754 RepID=UPI0035C9900B
MRPMILLLALPLLAAAPQEQPTSCPTPAAALPAELAGWKTGLSLAAATDRNSLAHTRLKLGLRSEVMLAATDTVRYVVAPTKPAEPASQSGMLGFTVARAGTYRVALGTAAWIDVVKGRNALESIAHSHGPACSGIRKLVDFKLTPGRYVLQIEGSKDSATPVLITRLS